MSQSNLEIVRAIYEEWGRGNFRTAYFYDRNVVFVEGSQTESGGQTPDAGVYVGMDGLRTYMRNFLSTWSSVTIEPEEIREVGDSIFVAVLQRTVGREGGVPIEFHYFQVWTLRAGLVTRLDVLVDREEALEAVGLSE